MDFWDTCSGRAGMKSQKRLNNKFAPAKDMLCVVLSDLSEFVSQGELHDTRLRQQARVIAEGGWHRLERRRGGIA